VGPRRGAYASIVVAALVAACATAQPSLPPATGEPSAPGSASVTPAASVAVDPGLWSAPADPLDVTVETDASARVEKAVEAAGATLEAVGADGSRYTLTIPRQRAWQPTAISMAPITSISGRGKTAGPGVVFGVQLGPSGLQLYPDASLRIEPAISLDDQAIVYFGYEGEGADAGTVVPDLREAGHVLAIDQFSGAGIVRRTAPATGVDDEGGMYEVLFDQLASRVAANRLSHVVARQLAIHRNAAILGVELDDTTADQSEAWQESYLSEVIEPLIRVAENPAATCEQAGEAVASLMGAARQRALLGVGDDDEAMTRVTRAYEDAALRVEPLVEAACRRDAARACRESGDPGDVVRRALVEMRAKALLGAASDAQLDAVTEAYRAILRWCAVYELKWTSTVSIESPEYTIKSVIDGHMTVRLVEDDTGDLGSNRIEGKTESALLPFLTSVQCRSIADITCAPGAVPQAPTSGVATELQIRAISTTQVGGQPIIRTIGENKLVLEFGPSPMVLTMLIKTDAGTVTLRLEIYKAPYSVAHAPDLVGGILRITDWDHVGHPLMFKKTYAGTRSRDGVKYSDSTVFTFTHTPDPAT
jgi:hypothetical protein